MIYFVTKSLLDLDFVRSFGVNVKDDPDSAIGYFGTGLKYALAVCARLGYSVTMYRDGVPHKFSTRMVTLRGKDFEFITLDDEQLAFTTELGKNWLPWMAFREFYCNTLDEHGHISNSRPQDISQGTVFTIEGMDDLFRNRTDYFILPEERPLYNNTRIAVYSGNTPAGYCLGVRATEFLKPAMHRYNLTYRANLTEDRTLISGDWDIARALQELVCASNDEDFITRIICASDTYWESEINIFSSTIATAGDTFKRIIEELISKRSQALNRPWRNAYVNTFGKQALTINPAPLNVVETKQLQRAVNFCKQLGFDVDNYSILSTDSLDRNLLGLVMNKQIVLAKRAFQLGTKQVAGTLIEEYLHITQELQDETRDMQNFLIDQIVTLGEQLQGEPL